MLVENSYKSRNGESELLTPQIGKSVAQRGIGVRVACLETIGRKFPGSLRDRRFKSRRSRQLSATCSQLRACLLQRRLRGVHMPWNAVDDGLINLNWIHQRRVPRGHANPRSLSIHIRKACALTITLTAMWIALHIVIESRSSTIAIAHFSFALLAIELRHMLSLALLPLALLAVAFHAIAFLDQPALLSLLLLSLSLLLLSLLSLLLCTSLCVALRLALVHKVTRFVEYSLRALHLRGD
mmetsp:Transcript_6415/g.16734  ORF Transcript_6415/g.16734 Transcript_6415/m.16734 type:complete len:240 (-) Transcript_6415:2192-2911(-)